MRNGYVLESRGRGRKSRARAPRPRCRIELFAAIVPTLVSVPPAWGATWTIGGEDSPDAATITQGVAMAASGDTLLIQPGTYIESVSTSKGLTLKALGAAGSVILDANSSGSALAFSDAPDDVVLDGLLLRNGQASRGGGACFDSLSGLVLIKDCRFEGNLATVSGGAIDAQDCQITLSGCELVNNGVHGGSEQRGGAVNFRGGTTGSLIQLCTFSENIADYGAALSFEGSLTLEDCHLDHNQGVQGSAVWSGSAVLASISDCEFDTNLGTGHGGAIYLNGDGNEIQACTFVNNQCSDYGGAIYLGSGAETSTIEWCVFANNEASRGGALAAASMLQEVRHCTFYGNGATESGSALYLEATSATVAQNVFAAQWGTAAVGCEPTAAPSYSCNLFWTNTAGPISGCLDPLGANGNSEQNPLFCDAEGGNFTVEAISPCAPGNEPLGCPEDGIGAGQAACGISPIERGTWGQIKQRFR